MCVCFFLFLVSTVAVVVAFFICWAPFHSQRLLAVYAENNKKDKHKLAIVTPVYTALTYISGIFYYLSTTINPLLYNIMSNKFREAFKVTYISNFAPKSGCKSRGESTKKFIITLYIIDATMSINEDTNI